jgi:hypothetical protein
MGGQKRPKKVQNRPFSFGHAQPPSEGYKAFQLKEAEIYANSMAF